MSDAEPYKFEMERLGVPIIETQGRFDETVAVLQDLLTREKVSWDGQYDRFELPTQHL